MISQLFLGLSLAGAQWVLYLLALISILSVALILERILFYRAATKSLAEFRRDVRLAVNSGQTESALRLARERMGPAYARAPDLETAMVEALLSSRPSDKAEVLNELALDAVLRARTQWEKNLAPLATIGSNAPFVGLFGTVLGIIQAFHDLSRQAATGGAQTVTAGISEALVATAIGILVAIPAVVAFNLFSRRVKAATVDAEAMKSFLVAKTAK
ncbi:MAG: MotA/TolQ/ExbB proton channel family protein [Deltaproteobacteria bacterium]|nr:MotA/TolQ/ExbB proton channel family protein [Deltaproteobacteria bacterium]